MTSPRRGAGAVIALVAGAVLVVILVVGGGVAIASKLAPGPEDQVAKYVAALEDGDAERVLSLIEGAYRPDESALLTQDVLDSMRGRTSDFEVDQWNASGGEAHVRITYTLDGIQQFAVIELRRSSAFIEAFGTWEIVDPGLSTLSVKADAASEVQVNGASVDSEVFILEREQHVFPGTYEVTPRSGSKFLAYAPQSVPIGSFSETLVFEVGPTDELLPEVTRQADDYLARCIAQREIAPCRAPTRRTSTMSTASSTTSGGGSPGRRVTRSGDVTAACGRSRRRRAAQTSRPGGRPCAAARRPRSSRTGSASSSAASCGSRATSPR